MKQSLIVFVLASSLAAFGQGRPASHPGGQPSGMPTMGSGAGMGHGSGAADSRGSVGQSQGMSQTQQPLKSAQTNSGAFRMLENKTGMTSDQLQQLYASSGAKNFGQFVSAIVVSKNLGLDTNQVLNGLKTQSLGQTLQSLGVSKDAAKDAIKKANKEVKDAEKQS
ncbi:MAG: hypothetical protein HY233_00865 [Acidobacteriales bacterium]|nr:hypothetical protein [Terriglobales bacterium]